MELRLFRCGFVSEKQKENKDKLCVDAIQQLEEYLSGKRKVFDLPLKVEGTAFRKKYGKRYAALLMEKLALIRRLRYKLEMRGHAER